jgi:Flp pilus assembly protein TadG
VHLIESQDATGKETGQILPLYALLLPLLLLFVGLGIDFGFAYLTKAQLAKASDAVSLAVMRNLGRGQTKASAIGQSEFALNYDANWGLNASAPTLSITYSSDQYGDPIVNVVATAKIKTFFIGLAGFKTLTVANYSQATRPPVILSLVLDKSGSMPLNGGAAALPGSVQDFLGYFIEGTDRLGEISFESISTQDVAISQRFQTPIQNSVNRMAFGGATFAQGGLLDAQTQVTGVSNPPPNAVQVVVFFTDGWANSIQATVAGSKVNFGGCAPAEFAVGWCNGVSCWNAANGASIGGTVVGSTNTAVTCDGVKTFTPQDTADLGKSATLTIQNIATEADYRAVQLANSMRAQGITVYSIGLGDKINQTYLQELANDPASPQYDATLPSGLAEFAPTASELDTAFQTIASKILLRLTQ